MLYNFKKSETKFHVFGCDDNSTEANLLVKYFRKQPLYIMDNFPGDFHYISKLWFFLRFDSKKGECVSISSWVFLTITSPNICYKDSKRYSVTIIMSIFNGNIQLYPLHKDFPSNAFYIHSSLLVDSASAHFYAVASIWIPKMQSVNIWSFASTMYIFNTIFLYAYYMM